MVHLAPRYILQRKYFGQGLIALTSLSLCCCEQGRTITRAREGEGRERAEAKQVESCWPNMESVTIRLYSLPANDASIVPRFFFFFVFIAKSWALRQRRAAVELEWGGITLRFNAGNDKFVREHCNPSSHIFGALHTQAEAVAVSTTEEVDELADIDWDALGFGILQTDYMYIMKCGKDGVFVEGDLTSFGNIELSPSAGVLNYGQALFEGLKAYRRADGRIVLFRPEENALRTINDAERLCMSAPSVEQFVEAVKQTVFANKRWIPPSGKGLLYVRPLRMGSGPVLGLAPAPEITFLIYVSPVGNYFKEGLAPIHLKVETKHHRATPGGTGGIKTIGNYAPVLSVQSRAKGNGFSDVVYLDAINKKYLEEVSSCNIFVVKDNVISTPALHGTILPGITRKSIIEVARNRGYEVQERLISVDELLVANEVFCTGTAVVVSPVGSITYLDKSVAYKNGISGGVSRELYSVLTGIQMGLSEDSMGWTMELN